MRLAYFQANNLSTGLYQTETEIRWRKDDNKIKKQTDINRHGPKLYVSSNTSQLSDPPHFSLVNTSQLSDPPHFSLVNTSQLSNPPHFSFFILLSMYCTTPWRRLYFFYWPYSGWPLKKTLFSDFVYPRHWTILLFMRRCFPAWIVLHLWRGSGTIRAGVWKQTRPRRRSFIQET